MKRSNSKKEGHPKSEDGNQQKISSFFQDGNQQKISSFFQKGAVQTQSKLFTGVRKSKPPLPMKQQDSIASLAACSGVSKHSSKPSMTVLKDFNSAAVKPVQRTPHKSERQALGPVFEESPDIVVIPDTPEDKLVRPVPRPSSRSFLCPVSKLSTMPGKRSPPKAKPKRTVKKSLGPVMIEFGAKRLSDVHEKEQPGSVDRVTDSETRNLVDKNYAVACAESAKSSTLQDIDYTDFAFEAGFSPKIRSPSPQLTESAQQVTERDSKQAVATPTKTYCDGSVKRMARSGSSPSPKKLFQAEVSGCNVSQEARPPVSEPSISLRTVKAKRQLAAMSGFKDVKEMNQSVNSYQLGGGSTKGANESTITCTEDNVLADILGQMNEDPVQEGQEPVATHGKERQGTSEAASSKFSAALEQNSEVKLNEPENYTVLTNAGEQRMEVEPSVASCGDDDVLGEILGELGKSFSEKQGASCHGRSSSSAVLPHTHQSWLSCERSVVKTCDVSGAQDAGIVELGGPQPVEDWIDADRLGNIERAGLKVTEPGDAVETKASREEISHIGGITGDCSEKTDKHGSDPSLNQTAVETLSCTNTSTHSNSTVLSKSEVDGTAFSLTPSKTKRKTRVENHDVPDCVEDMLAGSFGEMSPFKTDPTSRRQCQQYPSQTSTASVSQKKFTDKWNRFVVQHVHFDRQSHEKTLELSTEGKSEIIKKAVLQDSWSDTHLEPGDIVHFVSDEGQAPGPCKTDSDGIFLSGSDEIFLNDSGERQIVVNPDLLLSGTTIVSGVYCLRRSVLNEKFKGMDSKNVHMLYGSIIHSLFQEVLKDRLTKTEEIMATAKSIVQSNKFLHEMYGQSASEVKVMDEIQAYVGPLQTWLKKHVPSKTELKNERCSDLSIVQIHDIEETIWSPRLGVKGKIDMTVEVEVQKSRGQVTRNILPLELKTGRASYSVEHKGQVTLYSLMMSERRENPKEGLLLYLKHNNMNTVPVKPENKRGLLQLRNEMAYYLSRQTRKTVDEVGHVNYQLGCLPSPINSPRSCSKCPQLINCAIYQRSVEGLTHGADHTMSSLVPDTLLHLSDFHIAYFTHWLTCMGLEATCSSAEGLRNIWCMSSSERERKGDCLQQMVILESMLGVPETQVFSEGKGCCVQLHRRQGFEGRALNQVGLSTNDSVVLSTEDGRYIALSTGFIKNITEAVVDVIVDRDSFHENAAFQSLVFRIDRCDVFNTSGYLLSSLSRLMEPTPHSQRLRSLIIDGRKPEFQLKLSKNSVEKVKRIFKPLNKPQKTAILKVLMSKDFVLIKGYPGTGKTSTIVAMVKILRQLGQSVLLTSYTHSAVDNILLKLKKDDVPFLRLGRSSRIHPEIQPHAAETLTLDITSVDDLREFYSSYGVVATSCLGINHALFTQRDKFDVCIVDEASQVLQPACLGPLFNAHRFVLVGDPQQLPPVVQSKEASGLGMAESLFARLDGAGATYDLNLQYRMNSAIMQLPNELVYNGALQCGDHDVSHACIQPADSSVASKAEWLQRALDTSLSHAVVFLDTSQITAPEISDGRGVTNQMEASLILTLCNAFIEAGICARDMGIIAPYRAQVRSLQQQISDSFPLKDIEVNTVDQYQGRDKSVVFISFVRSTSAAPDSVSRGGLLQDIRRLNVAVTRAKHKLVLVGNSVTLRHYQPVDSLLNNLQSRKQMYILPQHLQLSNDEDA